MRPTITLNQDGTPSFEFTAAPGTTDIDQTIDRLLELPHQVAQRRKRQAVLVLDEFQEIVVLDPELPARMRATFQFQPDVAHVYLGSRQHLLRQVVTDANAPLYNSAKVFPPGPIPREAFSRFIAERFASTAVSITNDAIGHLLDITSGHPHDTQKLGYFTWAAAEGESTPATPETVDRAFLTAIATDTARYTELWDGLTTTSDDSWRHSARPAQPKRYYPRTSADATAWARTLPPNALLNPWWTVAWWNVKDGVVSSFPTYASGTGFVCRVPAE